MMTLDDAITYAERHTLHVLLVCREGAEPVVRCASGWDIERPHPIYSGTKSFWGIAAAAASDDGLLDLDEPVAATLTEWRNDAWKTALTIRQLLTLTSGYGFGGLGNAVPTVERALRIPLKNEPGSTFTYGGIPLQIFGEVLRRKVAPRFASPHAYLQARILDPIGMHVAGWRVLRDGTQPLPTGAFVAAKHWVKLGQLILARGGGVVSAGAFEQCLTATSANPSYGLGLWLEHRAGAIGTIYAGGAGGQALYILPTERIVTVHFGQSASWGHAAFIKRLRAAAL